MQRAYEAWGGVMCLGVMENLDKDEPGLRSYNNCRRRDFCRNASRILRRRENTAPWLISRRRESSRTNCPPEWTK